MGGEMADGIRVKVSGRGVLSFWDSDEARQAVHEFVDAFFDAKPSRYQRSLDIGVAKTWLMRPSEFTVSSREREVA